MQSLTLTLKGFSGVRDGLSLDVLMLDFERLANGALVVAIRRGQRRRQEHGVGLRHAVPDHVLGGGRVQLHVGAGLAEFVVFEGAEVDPAAVRVSRASPCAQS